MASVQPAPCNTLWGLESKSSFTRVADVLNARSFQLAAIRCRRVYIQGADVFDLQHFPIDHKPFAALA